MNRLTRPYCCFASCFAFFAGAAWLAAPGPARAQAHIDAVIVDGAPQTAAASTQGYLGIDITDLDAGKAQALRLKDTHGAVVTLIDHDAPAGHVGLKVNDVVLQLNGQPIDGAEQFRRMMKAMPPGRRITLAISRDGSLQSIAVQLVDRSVMEKNVWNHLGSSSSVPEMGILSGDTMPSGFHLPSFGSTLKVGALVEPLTAQMAAALGVDSGLMVKQVARKSEAEKAGLRAFDVILKVGSEPIATSADWDRALRSNQAQPVQVTILRDKKQQTVTLDVDAKHHRGAVEQQDFFGPEEQQEIAKLENNLLQLVGHLL